MTDADTRDLYRRSRLEDGRTVQDVIDKHPAGGGAVMDEDEARRLSAFFMDRIRQTDPEGESPEIDGPPSGSVRRE